MRVGALVVVLGLLALLGACLLFRGPARINDWPIVNAPPGAGPVLCFGDSLVAGTGADRPEESYPAQLQALLNRQVVGHGTPGQTAEEGLRDLRASPTLTGAVAVVTLGGNDILRRIPLSKTEELLAQVFQELQKRGAMVAFTGVENPMGGGRQKRYRALCRRNGVILVPDVLGRILGDENLRSDQIHPNGAGYRLMAEEVANVLQPFLTLPAVP